MILGVLPGLDPHILVEQRMPERGYVAAGEDRWIIRTQRRVDPDPDIDAQAGADSQLAVCLDADPDDREIARQNLAGRELNRAQRIARARHEPLDHCAHPHTDPLGAVALGQLISDDGRNDPGKQTVGRFDQSRIDALRAR
jgi:hypothetical protein